LECIECGETYTKEKIRYRCLCGQSLEVIYNYDEIKDAVSWKKLRKRPFRHWRYREFFPLFKDKNRVSLMEGGTPLLRSRNISIELGFEELYFKCESENPTGSFKDRGTTVEISKALEFDARHIVCASTGNMGASVSAYAAAASITATIILPSDTAEVKIAQIKCHGAHIRKVRGDYNAAEAEAFRIYNQKGWYLMGDYPYRGEGEKSVAFEIADEINADYIVSPIGNGTLIHSIWKGLKELKKTKLVRKLPRLIGIQASGCNTVVKAFKNENAFIKPVKPRTVAGAIACGNPLDGFKALHALRECNGLAETVTDREIIKAKDLLAKKEGIFAEPAGAASLAGLIKLKENIVKGSTIVLIISGSGLKTPMI
jgi:threonine synthase